jgi:restriction endonuclease S subunit
MKLMRHTTVKGGPVPELPVLPSHWRALQLRRIISVQSGDILSTAEETPEGYPIIGGNGYRGYTHSSNAPADSLVIGRVGAHCGNIHHILTDFWATEHAFRVTLKEAVHNRYLFWALTALDLNRFAIRTAQPLLNTTLVETQWLALPPAAEQASISSFLDRETTKIDALIAEKERLIALLQEKRHAVISHAVTKGLDTNVPMKDSGVEWIGPVPERWEVCRCSRLLTVIPGFAFPADEFSHDEADTRLLRGINVGVSSIRWDDTVYWRRSPGDGLDRFALREGDVVLGMDRPVIGGGVRVATVSVSDLPCLLLQRVALLRPDDGLSPRFLEYVLSTSMFAAHFLPDATGVSVPHISPEQIRSFVLAVPSIDQQRRIVSWIERQTSSMTAVIAESEQALRLLRERRTALITAAVTGRIDVRHLVEAAA